MAAAPGLLLWLLLLGPPWPVPGQPEPAPGRRFSQDKVCADEECSMLMYRGEALEDFTGPDCRFVNFKKGDPVYVYYKLAGGSPEVWAGSVGRTFGYFPKDLIRVVHEYTQEELQVPTDETDFVCFDGGRDDFDNYNVEELLGFLELYDSVPGDSEGVQEKTSQQVEEPPEASEESDPEPEPGEPSSQESESVFSENTEEPRERQEAQKSHPHGSSQTDPAQGEQSSFEPFGEMLQDKLKVPESERSKTSNSSQVSNEQEKIDAYKLLKTEMTLDLKTKFGSTADAFVSDDETTRFVTSLEDDFDEELEGEYYTVGKEEEESKDGVDDLPLLTFADGEDPAPANSGAEKHPTEKEQTWKEASQAGETQPPGIQYGEKNAEEDSTFSVVAEGEENTGADLETWDSKEAKAGDEASVPGRNVGTARPASASGDPEEAADGLRKVEVPRSSQDQDPEAPAELHVQGQGREAERPGRDLAAREAAGSEDETRRSGTRHASAQSGHPSPPPAAEEDAETFPSAFASKENDLEGAAVHISKDWPGEEQPGAQQLEGGSEGASVPRAAGIPGGERELGQAPSGIAAPRADGQPDASRARGKEDGGSGIGPAPPPLSGEHLGEDQPGKSQNRTRFSSPDAPAPPRNPGEEGPAPGSSLSGQQEGGAAAAFLQQGSDDGGLSDQEAAEDAPEEGPAHREPAAAPREAGVTEVPGLRPEHPEADEDDYAPEELLEDENAVSAKRSKEMSPEVEDAGLDADPQASAKALLGAVHADPEPGENKGETNNTVETGRKSDPAGEGVDARGGDPSSPVVEKGESSLVGQKGQSPSEGRDLPDKRANQTAGLGAASQHKAPDYFNEDGLQEPPGAPGLLGKPGAELLKEDEEDVAKLVDAGLRGSAPEDQDSDLPPWAPHAPVQQELGVPPEDLPIIGSFFKEQQSLERFQKYFDVQELEALFQEMSSKLKSAQRESLPYNVEKVLDKVFRASESHILSVAEEMLDTRVTEDRDPAMRDSIFSEEAAVLDDVHELIYFVRYTYSAKEEAAPLAAAQPAEEGRPGPAEEGRPGPAEEGRPGPAEEGRPGPAEESSAGLAEDIQPPLEESGPQESTAALTMQVPEEPSHVHQPVTRDMGPLEASQKPETEKARNPGPFTTEGTPVIDAVGAKKQLETSAEEAAGVTPLDNAILLICSMVFCLTKMLVATLPDDVQPGPDFYGLPWKPVLITAFLGIVSFAIFFWRTILVVKNRVYQVTEQQISEKLKNIMKENAELVQKLSSYEQKIKESKKHVQETKKQNMILSDEAVKFKDKIKNLEETNETLGDTAKSLRALLESEREQNAKNQDLISENKKSIEKLKDVISVNASEFSEVQIALNEAKLSEEKVKSECHRVQEENARLKKKKEQLQEEIKDWSKAHAELSEQIRSFERAQQDLEVALTHKDDNVNALTNCITQLNCLDCESESEGQNQGGNESDELANGEAGGDRTEKMKSQIKQMMDVSRTQTAISVVEEDLKLLQCKLRASMSAKCTLEDQVKKLEEDCGSLQASKATLEEECKTLRQKVEILNELYQQKEMALQKKLSQEEFERQDREQRLSAADEKVLLAAEEVKTYKRRIEEMEDELQKTERSFKNQIATHEKKAHDNWLKARAAERAMAEERREAANLRHRLLELTQKMAMLQEEPVIVKPMPGRPNTQNPPRRGPLSQNGSFGPSPVSGGECSPPLTADPPARPLSATLSRREMPRSDFGSVDGPPPRPRWPPEASGKPSASDPESAPMVNSSSRSSSPSKVTDEGKVNMAARGPPPFPGAPLLSSPGGGPLLPAIRYGPPPQLCGPFGPRPLPPPFGPGLCPPLGLREYAPGVPPGKRDLPLDPREFLPGHAPFRPVGPLGPREYFMPGARLPPPPHGPQDYPPSSAARDLAPSGSRDEPQPASPSAGQDCAQALKQSP
ncbi:transport and Golgi organization protein 1 homolog isoform X2 [Phacochoerus africanus]|uniref:transport and Golgi organization protein 1 homolog isoform X2 n=1 Tax=Phacochoerus africanus TaxID=41426 RepID=UPI001FD96A03|nr:transport and Golgi organization protein 1 homolog isoform X2 [Phacochoerus africanus]